MSDLFEYVRVFLFEKFPRNISLGTQFVSATELIAFFRSRYEELLKEYDVVDHLPIAQITDDLFQEFLDNGLIESFDDPLAGKYYWADLGKVRGYMNAELAGSEIFDRKQRLRGDRLYEAVFDRVKTGEIDISLEKDDPVSWGERTPTVKAVLSESERAEFVSYLAPMRDEIENADISQSERVDALAALDAVEKLSEAPNPLWQAIALILSSPILSNITAIAALAIAILKP